MTVQTAPKDGRGMLSVAIRSSIESFASIEIRDNCMRLVERAQNVDNLDLEAGLYEVSAVLQDGRKHSVLARVQAGTNTIVELAMSTRGGHQRKRDTSSSVQMTDYDRPTFTLETESLVGAERNLLGGSDRPIDEVLKAPLIHVSKARLSHATDDLWIFQYDGDPDAVASARFKIDGQLWEISLPMSSGGDNCDTSVVQIEKTASRFRIHAWIPPERGPTNAVQNMMTSGYVLEAADIADSADRLLRLKYGDPTGAALGALILLKTGRIRRRVDWLENLARDFDWLPDGKIILSHILFEDGVRKEDSKMYAIRACSQRILYTESYSLLLNLLRRWPLDERDDAWRSAMEKMSSLASEVDWDSICLSHELSGQIIC